MNSAANIGLTVVDEVAGVSTGIYADPDGGFIAITLTESREFKTSIAAIKWLATCGYNADGTKKGRV